MFDDDFVRGAPTTERSADERLAELRRAESMLRVPAPSVPVRRRRRFPAGALVVLLVVALLAAVVVRRTSGSGGSGATMFGDDPDVFMIDGEITSYPSPPSDPGDVPLGQAPIVADDGGYAFVATQDGEPVRWDPCRPIRLVVTGEAEVLESRRMLEEATAVIARATGLVFEIEGATSEAVTPDRAPVLERYGDRWAPVLVGWTDPAVVPDLGGAVAGVAGAQRIEPANGGPEVLVTGSVYLDAPTFREMLVRRGGWEQARAILIHELAHLVGLDHVADPNQLMYEANTGQTQLGSGDRAGLARLGGGPCVPSL